MMIAWLRRSPIAVKVLIAPVIAIIGLVSLGALAIYANSLLTSKLDHLSDVVMPRALSAGELAGAVAELDARVNRSLAWEGVGVSADKISALDADILRDLSALRTAMQKEQTGERSEKESKLISDALGAYATYSDSVRAALDIKSGMVANAASYITVMESSYAQMQDALSRLAGNQAALAAQAADAGEQQSRVNKWAIGLGALVAVSCTLLLSYFVSRLIVRPLQTASKVALDIAQGGDLGHRIPDVPVCGDEIVTMANSFNAMVEQVESGARVIRKKSNDMAAMLKTMPQGLLTIDENNVVQPEYSAHLAAILETDEIAGLSVMELVFAGTTLSSDALSQVEAIAGACVGEDAMNFTFNRHLLVPEIEKVMPDGRTKVLELTWSAIVNDADVTEQILLCIRDVTELRQLSQEAAAQKRELEIIGQVLAVPVEKFEAMMASAYEHLERTEEIVRVSAGGVEAVNDAFKHLHTIKGNARTYALKHLASVVHDAEQVYADLRSGQAQAQWDTRELLSGLDELRSEIAAHERISREKLSRKADGAPKTMCVSEEELRALLDKLHRASESQSIDVLRSVVHQAHRVLRRIKAQSFKSIADDIVAGLSDLARDLGKPAPQVHIEDDVVAIDTQASMALSDAFVHILRNALDHGIESPEERQAAGKPQAGRIEVTTRVDEDWVTVTVRDDGRGLALQRIRADAQAKGLVADAASLDDQAAANLIFVAGFSTAERVTMVSGRGVGMDAVQSAVRALGGDVSIRFEDDRTGADYRQFSMLVKVPASLAVNFNQ
jgi:signal transduction histidine kinase